MKLTILYSEIAEYSVACFKALKALGCEVQLVHWPINPEAPFQFDLSFLDDVTSRDLLDRPALFHKVIQFSPDLILCSGWMDKDYLAVCRKMRFKSVNVLSLDNHWNGSIKQRIASFIAPFTIRMLFHKAFVPGNSQRIYAQRLGFASEDVQLGFYSADTTKFNGFYEAINAQKFTAFPKRFLYLGRYTKHKGIFELWAAFQQFKKSNPEWELWCVGTGDQYENRVEGDGIRHFGFKQPNELLLILQATGVYILPSHFEPWGVSVHEMAVAGFPMLLSDAIGAKEAFLSPDENGRIFKSNSVPHLLSAMQWIADQPEDRLREMATTSHELGLQNSPQIWAAKLLALMQKSH